jgi:hypothetical protein
MSLSFNKIPTNNSEWCNFQSIKWQIYRLFAHDALLSKSLKAGALMIIKTVLYLREISGIIWWYLLLSLVPMLRIGVFSSFVFVNGTGGFKIFLFFILLIYPAHIPSRGNLLSTTTWAGITGRHTQHLTLNRTLRRTFKLTKPGQAPAT